MSNHLKSCPANVVVCSAEWNRAPVVSAERQRNIPFRQSNPRGKKGQLGKEKNHVRQNTVVGVMCLWRIFGVVFESLFCYTRPKPAFGRQGLDWDCWARIQFSQVHFGAFCHSRGGPTDLLWSKKRHVTNGGSN